MDLDFDLGEDRVSTYLLSKLEEVKANNEKLEQTLQNRLQYINEIAESTEIEDDSIKIKSDLWKKIFNGKYILGITLENNGPRCNDPRIILHWNSEYDLQYEVFMYEETDIPVLKTLTYSTFICKKENCDDIINGIKKSDALDKLTHLLVVLKQPKFIDRISFTIEGNITFQRNEKGVILKIPAMEISSYDLTNHDLYNLSLPNGDVKEIMTVISSCEHTELKMILPSDWTHSFNSTFEILCSLTKINIEASCRRLFVAHRLSVDFDNSVLIIHAPGEANSHCFSLSVYSRNEESLYSVLHHLYQNIPGVLIIPESLYQNYIIQHPEALSVETASTKLNECLKKEINFVKSVLNGLQNSQTVDRKEISDKFSDLQRDSNLHYLKLRSVLSFHNEDDDQEDV